MGKSVLVFISHSSEDKESLIEPIVEDLESCFINVWIDKRKIIPGENLRKSIFRDGLDKADVALIFFTKQSLKSSWVDREIKHVLREESKKGNNFDLNKIISIFDSQETYQEISERYPELTDDLLHLMPNEYDKIQLGQLISAIWSKYLSLQGGDIETQRQLLAKDKELFQSEKTIEGLRAELEKQKTASSTVNSEFEIFYKSGLIDNFINKGRFLLENGATNERIPNYTEAAAFGLIQSSSSTFSRITPLGRNFFKWVILKEAKDNN